MIENGVTRSVSPPTEPSTAGVGGFGRWGGRQGGSMCFSEYADQSVMMANGEQRVLIKPNDQAIVYAARTDLARSSGVWGVVSGATAKVRIQDSARPEGVTVPVTSMTTGDSTDLATELGDLGIFVVPVSSGPVTVTAIDGAGVDIGSVDVD